jgi:hypothetical protein
MQGNEELREPAEGERKGKRNNQVKICFGCEFFKQYLNGILIFCLRQK